MRYLCRIKTIIDVQPLKIIVMKFGTISFKELLKGNHNEPVGELPAFEDDVNSCVLVGLDFGDAVNELDKVAETLLEDYKECGFVTADVEISHILRITGNVLGDEGRKDWLVVFDGDPKYNCVKRFQCYWKTCWVCDFTVNYRKDYDPDYDLEDDTDYDN